MGFRHLLENKFAIKQEDKSEILQDGKEIACLKTRS